MQAMKFILVALFICSSVVESRHNYNDHLRLSREKDVDNSSEENFKKLKDLKEFNALKHSIQEHKLEKVENRRDYIRYSSRRAHKNENYSDESSLTDSSEDNSKFSMHSRINNESQNYFNKDDVKSTSNDSSYSKDDNSDESNEDSRERSTEIEWDSQERDDYAFYRNRHNLGTESKFIQNKSKNSNNRQKNSQSKYDSIEAIENINKDKSSGSDESYRYVFKNIYNNVKSDYRKTRENKSATIHSSENFSIDDSNENKKLIKNCNESVESQKHQQSSETDSISVEDKVRSTEGIDSQEYNSFSGSSEFKNKKHFQESSRNYELSSVYHNFRKNLVQRKNIKMKNQLNRIPESARSINTKNVHDNEVHKILKESIVKKWREMDIAVKLILIDNYRSIKNSLLQEVNNNPRATNRDISRLERKLLLLFNMTKKDILQTVQLTRKKFRFETAKLNLGQLQVYEMEQLYMSKLREQIDAKVIALKRNIAFDIEQFHQEVKPVEDYTTQIVTHQTNTEIPFDPVSEITTTQANIVTGNPSSSTLGFAHVEIGNMTPSNLIEVDDSLNLNKTETEVGSHKITDRRQKEKNSQQNGRSLNNLNTQTTNYIIFTPSESPEETTNNSYDQVTVHTTIDPTISTKLSIGSLPTTQSPTNAEVTSSVISFTKNNNTTTSNQPREILFSAIVTPTSSMPISLPSSKNVNIASSNIETANSTSDQRSTVAVTGSTTNEITSANASSTMQMLPNSTVTSVPNSLKQYNITTSTQPDNKTTELTVKSAYPASEISSRSLSSSLLPTKTANTATFNTETVNNISDLKSTVTVTSSTTNEITSPNALSTEASSYSTVTSVPSTMKRYNITASNEPDSNASKITAESISSAISNSMPTGLSSASITNTEQIDLTGMNNSYNQKTSEIADSSTTSEYPSFVASSTTQTPTTSDVTSAFINVTKQNDLSVSNQPDKKALETTTELTSPSSENCINSTATSISSTAIIDTEQTHLITTSNPSNQRTTKTDTHITSENPPTQALPATQTTTTSDFTPFVMNTTKQNNLAVGNQYNNKESETIAETTPSVTETSTDLTNTRLPTITATNTEQTNSVTVNKSTKSLHTTPESTTESIGSATNGLENVSQNVNECVDDSGLVINCESIIKPSTTTMANLNLPNDEISQKWPGVPQECLPLFLAPNGEILSSVSTEHSISDPQTLDLCLMIAKTIIQLNDPNSNKSVTA